jgi:exosome complex protein LRP1
LPKIYAHLLTTPFSPLINKKMDDSIAPAIADLNDSIADLEKTIAPLISAGPLSTASSKLPLLDKAKLYVLATYALESILFSYLRLNGVDAKEHDVFKELARVKEYFSKIATAEGRGKGAAQPRLDKGAAGRFIKAGLAGNEPRKLEDMEGKGTHTRFEAAGRRLQEAEESIPVVKASEVDDEEDVAVKQMDADGVPSKKTKKAKKAKRPRTDEENKERDDRKKAKREKRQVREGKRYEHLMEDSA